MSNFKKFYIATFLSEFYFWPGIAIPFLLYRDLPIDLALAVMAIYNISVVILEYPTGVIGDYFGHKISVTLGMITMGLAFLLMTLNVSNYLFYFLCSFLLGLGDSMQSGSNDAMLKHIKGKDFASSYKSYLAIKSFLIAVAASIAGTLSSISFEFVIVLNGILLIISGFVFQSISIKNDNNSKLHEGNIFNTAIEGIKFSQSNSKIKAIIMLLTVSLGYQIASKSIIGSLDNSFEIDIKLISLFIGLSYLIKSVGYQFHDAISFIGNKSSLLIIIILFILSALFNNPYIIVLNLLLVNLLTSVIDIRGRVIIHDQVDNKIRASVMSLHKLLARFFSSGYLFIAGYILNIYSFSVLMIFSAVIILATLLVFSLSKNE